MAQTLAGKDQWFVVHVLSGQENKVKENIEKRVKTEEMSDLIYEVLVPTERVSEIKKGKKSETTRKFFPGYLIVNMHLLDENNQLVGRTWYFIRETPGVIGFAGTKDKPIPKREGYIRPNEITVMKDKSFSDIITSPTAANVLKKAAKLAAGSKAPNKEKRSKDTRKQEIDFVKTEARNLGTPSDEAAVRIID